MFMRILLFTIAFISSMTLVGQSSEQFFEAIKASDFDKMSTMLDSDVELCIKSGTEMLSKAEALRDIKAFLAEYQPKSVKSIHSGSNARNASKYKVAKLVTSNGTYRVFVYMEGGNKISEVRFDPF
jgi:hypothetical protein